MSNSNKSKLQIANLSLLEYQVTQKGATETPFTGKYWNFWEDGEYICICCNTPLFDSTDKFDAKCGWPSYSQPLKKSNVTEQLDYSHNMMRTEVCCNTCGAHLGHVFADGPLPTGLRYCINSVALKFKQR